MVCYCRIAKTSGILPLHTAAGGNCLGLHQTRGYKKGHLLYFSLGVPSHAAALTFIML